VPRQLEQTILNRLKTLLQEQYGEDPQRSPDYSRIINERHCQRLQHLITQGSHQVFYGGRVDPADHYVSPTILTQVNPQDPVMQEEIFGPVLPVLPVDSLDEAITFINSRPHPLALYIFSSNVEHQNYILSRTSSGSVCINDSVLQVAVPTLPFGGVGDSGMGSYNGKYTFDLFSHARSILYRPTWVDPDIRYPPYTPQKLRILSLLGRIKAPRRIWLVLIVVVLLAVFIRYLLASGLLGA
jgi:aldehyde dehydrogenase (NAD+)